MNSEQRGSEGITCLTFSASEIKFQYVQDKYMKSVLTITNISNTLVAYKIKATNPKIFLVKPNIGQLEKGTRINIDLTMHPKVFDGGIQNFNEKIQILAAPLSPAINFVDIFKDPSVKSQIQKFNIVIVGSNNQILTQSQTRKSTKSASFFESIVQSSNLTQSEGLKTQSPSLKQDKILKDIQQKEEQYNQILRETTEFQSKLKVHKKQSTFSNFLKFLLFILLGFFLAIYRIQLSDYIQDFISKTTFQLPFSSNEINKQ